MESRVKTNLCRFAASVIGLRAFTLCSAQHGHVHTCTLAAFDTVSNQVSTLNPRPGSFLAHNFQKQCVLSCRFNAMKVTRYREGHGAEKVTVTL